MILLPDITSLCQVSCRITQVVRLPIGVAQEYAMRFLFRTVFLALLCVTYPGLPSAQAAITALESMGTQGVAGNGPSWGPGF